MSLRLIDSNKIPPGHIFPYVDPDTKARITAGNFSGLLTRVYEHRTSNRLVPMPAEKVEENVCLRLIEAGHPQFCCDADNESIPAAPTLKLTWAHLLKGSVAIVYNIVSGLVTGNRYVDQAEAERRAAICVGCSYNVAPVDCAPCMMRPLQALVEELVGKQKTSLDEKLQSCWSCGCFNRIQVWFPIDQLHRLTSDHTNHSLPDHCWKKR